jgi:hypothetical protein
LALVQEVRGLLKKYGIDEIIHAKMQTLKTEIEHEIQALDIQEEHRSILFQLLEYSQNRSK